MIFREIYNRFSICNTQNLRKSPSYPCKLSNLLPICKRKNTADAHFIDLAHFTHILIIFVLKLMRMKKNK